MLLRVSRISFWLAALAALLALAIPTGCENLLTGFAVAASALAYLLWRAGLAQLRRFETGDALLPEAAGLSRSALDDAASLVEACCADATSFEAALHGVARILKSELGALRVSVYRVMGADDTHARVSELIEAQPGFHSAEHRVHLQRSAAGRSVATQREAIEPGGALALPIIGKGGAVAVIQMAGLQIDIEPEALTTLLTLTQTQLSRRAEPAAKVCRPSSAGRVSTRLGENAQSETFRTNAQPLRVTASAGVWHARR